MIASAWRPRTVLRILLALILTMGMLGSASAVPPTLNSTGLTPEQCYRRDSDCTRFCGDVSDEYRYECFRICDRMLDRCLTTGDWTDSLETDPGTGQPPDKRDLLAGLAVRMLMVLTDADGNGELTPREIQALRERVFVKEGKGSGSPSQTTKPTDKRQ